MPAPSVTLIEPPDHVAAGFEIVPDVLDRNEIADVAAALACRFLGRSAIPFRATLFDKSSDSNWLVVWHQDTALPLRKRHDRPGWGPWSVKAGIAYSHAPAVALSRVVALRLHVDDSLAVNGPLRVLPGTHTCGVMSDAEVARLARDVPAVECVSPAGGVVCMRPLLVHASSKAESHQRRRVLHIEYADSFDMGAGAGVDPRVSASDHNRLIRDAARRHLRPLGVRQGADRERGSTIEGGG